MMRIYDLLSGIDQLDVLGSPEMDPITERSALQEAQLVEITHDVVHSRVGLLFDLRNALQLRMHNTGLLIFGQVEHIKWSSIKRPHGRTAWNVMDSVPDNHDGVARLQLFLLGDAELEVSGHSASFFAGDVQGIGDRPPNYLKDSDDVVAAGTQSMISLFEPAQCAVLHVRQ